MLDWLNQSPANQEYFDQLLTIWAESQQLAAQSTVDEEKAWQKFRATIKRAEPAQPTVVRPKKVFPLLRIAASIVLVIGLGLAGLWIVQQNDNIAQQYVAAGPVVRQDTLPDGSVVTLNRQASISYPAAFKGKSRPVKLQGEAFFNVKADRKKPFVITVNDVEVTVVGTSFNIKSENGHTTVVVETGLVRVLRGGKMVELTAGEQLDIAPVNNELKKEKVEDKLYQYYRSRIFECDDTPLWKLVEVINDAYGANIIFGNESLKAKKINTTFNNESLEQVLEVIMATYPEIKVSKKEHLIILE